MTYQNFRDAAAALAFVTREAEAVSNIVLSKTYGQITYPELITVDESIAAFADSVRYDEFDIAGKAEFLSNNTNSVPLVTVSQDSATGPIFTAGVGYDYTQWEIDKAAALPSRPGQPALQTRKANAARLVAERFVQRLVINGSGEKGVSGLLNHPSVAAANVSGSTATERTFAEKIKTQAGRDAILADLFDLLSIPLAETNEVERPDTVLLPPSIKRLLAQTRLSDASDTTIWAFFMANNPYTDDTGQAPMVRTPIEAETAGASGKTRMVGYRNEEDVVTLPMAQRFTFFDPREYGAFGFMVPGALRVGAPHVHKPKAIVYRDGA